VTGERGNMVNVIATSRRYRRECSGTMEDRRGEYRYVESGLNSVIFKDILVFHCTKRNGDLSLG
jgi:hypothetical protein